MKNRLMCVLGFVLASVVATPAGDVQPLTFKFRKANVLGALQTILSYTNNAGVMVGQYEDKNGVFHGYILRPNGKLTTLDDPKGTSAFATRIQPNGTKVVGYYTNSSGSVTGFLYENGTYTDVPGPGGTPSGVGGINDKGDMAGGYVDSSGHYYGFLLQGATYTTLNPPGSVYTDATDINDKGHVTLYWVKSKGGFESSIYNGKIYKTINVPNATQSFALGLNNQDDIAYVWQDSNGASHGALLHAGTYYKFHYPKAGYSQPRGVNDKGVIVGAYGSTSNGPFSGFEATY